MAKAFNSLMNWWNKTDHHWMIAPVVKIIKYGHIKNGKLVGTDQFGNK
jgi:hypothetical protein